MKRYESYKPSGISWIGEIPSHWETAILGHLFEIEAGGDAKPEFYSFEKDEIHKFPVYTNAKDENSTYAYTSNPIYKANSITVTGRGDIGRAFFRTTEFDAIVRLLVLTKKNENIYSPFYVYYINSIQGITSDSAAIGQLSTQQLYPHKAVIPPLEEQKKIVEYLSTKTPLIDAQQSAREREIRLLEELKQAEIANAVTRGLNPNVPMKKAQTIQFGDIPAHWEERKMQYCFSERSQKGFPNETMLCATQSQGVIPQSSYANRVVVVNKDFGKQKLVKVGDYVISLRSFEGGIEYAYYQGIISAAYTILYPKEIEFSEYYKHLFKSFNFIQLLQTCVTGIREGQNINYPFLSKHFIPIPPLEEQRAIVEYIERKNKAIDDMIANLRAKIDFLTEYKQRLIADAVTGQIKID